MRRFDVDDDTCLYDLFGLFHAEPDLDVKGRVGCQSKGTSRQKKVRQKRERAWVSGFIEGHRSMRRVNSWLLATAIALNVFLIIMIFIFSPIGAVAHNFWRVGEERREEEKFKQQFTVAIISSL